MTEATPLTPDSPPPRTPPVKKKRWWRWPLRIVIALIVLAVLLVALLPTIAGLGFVRSIALGKANAYIPHGKLDVASWSVGWFSPIKVSGLKLYDDRGNVIIEADDIHTNLTLLQAVRQNFNLTGTVVDAAGHIVVYPNGETNLGRALGQYDPKPHETHKTEEPHPAQPQPQQNETTLPNVVADITLKLRGDVRMVDASEATVAQIRLLPGSGGTVRIPDINQPITTDLQFTYDTGEATKPGTIALKSSVDAIENNKLDLANLAATVDAPVRDVDFAGLKPLLALAGLNDVRLGGVLGGAISGELKPGQPSEIRSTLAVANFEASAPQLKDTIKADKLDLPLRVTRAVTNGTSRLSIDGGVILPDASVKITGDLPEPVLQKLAAKQMPGDTGALGVAVAADLKKLSTSLPNTLRLVPGLTITEGSFHTGVTATLRPSDIQSHVKTDLFVRGTKDGKPISVDPVTFTADATATDFANPVAGLRDLAVSMTSAFANFNAGGKSVAVIQGSGSADLDKARQQLAQVVDLGRLDLAGAATFSLSSTADPKDATVLQAKLQGDVQRLRLGLPNKPPLDLPLAATTVTAELVTDASGTKLQQVRTANASLMAGDDAKSPIVDAAVTASGVTLVDNAPQRVGEVTISKCAVPSLSRLQVLIDPFVPALKAQNIRATAGSANVVLTAKDIDLVKSAVTITQCEAKVLKAKIARGAQELLNDTIVFRTAGTVAAGEALTVDLSQLSFTSALAKIEKSAEPLRLKKEGDQIVGGGTVTVDVDFVQGNRIVRLATTQPSVPEVKSGRLNGTFSIATAANKDATLAFDAKVADLTLANSPIKQAAYAINLSAAVPPKMDRVAANLKLEGEGLSVVGRDIAARMPAEGVPPQQLVENARFDITVNDLARTETILKALVPGLSLPLDPSGAVTVNATVAKADVAVDLKATKLVVKNEKGQTYAFDSNKPVSLKLKAAITGDKAVDGVRVTDLNGDLGVATVAMNKPIAVSGLSTGKLAAAGDVSLAGDAKRLLAFLAVFQQSEKPMPYSGLYKVNLAFAPDGGGIGLKGNGTVDDFTVYGDDGKPTFAEKQVRFNNDVAVDTAVATASIRTLTLDMASSKAATVDVRGGVEDYLKQRRLKNVVVTVNAVGEKVLPILMAMMPEAQRQQFADAKLTGPIQLKLTADGSYPAADTWNQSIKTVTAYGDLSMKSLSTMGLDVSEFAMLITLKDGQLITGDTRKRGAARFAKPFVVNGGSGDVGSIVLNVADPEMRLSIGRRQKILQKVQLNPVLASQIGSLASVLFTESDQASGLIDLTVQECQNVPLLELMNKKATASFTYSVKDLDLRGPVPTGLSSALGWGSGGIQGDINNASLALKNGKAEQDMTLELARQKKERNEDNEKVTRNVTETIKFKGGIDLATNRFDGYHLTLSQGLLLRDIRDSFPDGATIELKGKVSDIGGALTRGIGELAVKKGVEKNAEKALDKILGGLKKKDK